MSYQKVFSLFKFIFLFSIPVVSHAQPPKGEYFINGKVLEAVSDKPMEYVTVVVYSNRDSSIVAGTITNSNGEFSIKLNRPGAFYLTADFIGYKKVYIEKILLKPGNETLSLEPISLKPAFVGIEEVEVTAEKPYMSYKLDRKVVEVSKNPMAQGGTAVDALENVPSIQIDIEGNVAVRGSSDFTVLIDGRQSPLTGSDALKQIPASAIDQIEIITNPSAKYDPDGTAGILNIITKKGKLNGHSLVANASYGNIPFDGNNPLASADLTYAYRANKYTLTTNAGFRNNKMNFINYDERETQEYDTLGNYIGKSYIYNNKNGIMQHGSYFFKAAVDYHLSELNTLSVGGSYNDFTFGRDFDSKIKTISINDSSGYELSKTGFLVNPQKLQINLGDKQVFKNNKDHYLSVDMFYEWGNKETLDSVGTYYSDANWGEIGLIQPKEKAITTETADRLRLETNYSHPVSDNLIFEAGYTLRIDTYTQDYNRYAKNSESDDWLLNASLTDKADFKRYINAGWLVMKGEALGLQYSTGLRLEHTDRSITTEKDNWDYSYKYLGWYPSLSIAREWKKGHTLQASYSKRINRPRDHHLNPFSSLSDGYVIFKPNPELQPEYASAVELNYQKNWGQNFIAVETYYRYTENEMERVQEVMGDTIIRTIINLGSETDAGGEMAANFKILKWWTLNPAASLSHNYVEGTYANDYTTASSTNFRASFSNNFFLPTKTRIQLMASYRGPRTEIDGTREQTYWVDAAVRQEFFDRKLSATFRINDIFSTRKREGYTYSENTTIYSKGQRKSPMMVLSLNYIMNPSSDKKRNGNGNGNGNGGDGMDMDF
jgi:outer membrane receptor protein involved in Fe transport